MKIFQVWYSWLPMKLYKEQNKPFRFWIGSKIKKIYIDSWTFFLIGDIYFWNIEISLKKIFFVTLWIILCDIIFYIIPCEQTIVNKFYKSPQFTRWSHLKDVQWYHAAGRGEGRPYFPAGATRAPPRTVYKLGVLFTFSPTSFLPCKRPRFICVFILWLFFFSNEGFLTLSLNFL